MNGHGVFPDWEAEDTAHDPTARHAAGMFAALRRAGVCGETDFLPEAGPWRLIECNASEETTAGAHLRRFGGEYYLPKTWRNVRRGGRIQVPLFSGYLFARIGGLTCRIQSIRGVRSTVISANCPSIPEVEIERLMRAEGPDGVVIEKKLRPEAKCKTGNVIKVTDGPFCGYPGVVSEVGQVKSDGRYKLEALINIFGRSTPVELKHDQFEVYATVDDPSDPALAPGFDFGKNNRR